MLIDSMIPEAAKQAGRPAGLISVLGFAVAHWRGTKGSYPPETVVVERH